MRKTKGGEWTGAKHKACNEARNIVNLWSASAVVALSGHILADLKESLRVWANLIFFAPYSTQKLLLALESHGLAASAAVRTQIIEQKAPGKE